MQKDVQTEDIKQREAGLHDNESQHKDRTEENSAFSTHGVIPL